MSELANYSIETDHTVLLAFKDGRRLRVPFGQLAHHLMPPDLDKVRAAIKLRREFIRRHMPKAALVLMAGGLIALLVAGGQAVANYISPHGPVPPPPDHSSIVRSQVLPTPAVSPASQPSVEGETTVASAAKPKPRFTLRQLFKPAPKPPAQVPAASPLASPLPDATPTPSASPNPIADGGTPNDPSPSPTPQIPNQGQVLGCTSSDPSGCTDSSSSLPAIP
jgi:hypothetical protein